MQLTLSPINQQHFDQKVGDCHTHYVGEVIGSLQMSHASIDEWETSLPFLPLSKPFIIVRPKHILEARNVSIIHGLRVMIHNVVIVITPKELSNQFMILAKTINNLPIHFSNRESAKLDVSRNFGSGNNRQNPGFRVILLLFEEFQHF